MGLGFWELAVLLVAVLLFFGAHKLPSAMGDIAQGIKAFKSGMKDGPEPAAPAPPPLLTDSRDERRG